GALAARRATAVYGYSEAVRLLEGALQAQEVLDPDDQATRCDLLLALGDALLPAGEAGRVTEAVAPEGLKLAEAPGDRRRAARTRNLPVEGDFRGIGARGARGGPFRRWSGLLEQYAEPNSVERVTALYARSWVVMATATPEQNVWLEYRRLMQEAVAVARRAGDVDALMLAASWFLNAELIPPTDHDDL